MNICPLNYYLRSIKQLPIDIIANILSDYIDYEYLIQLCKYSKDFRINPNRIKIKETNENNNKIKEIYIDGDLRKKETFNKDKIKILECGYKNGEREGKQYDWYENGQLEFEKNYKNGEFEGKQYGWYKNGQLQYQSNYKNEEKEGKQYSWDKNGKLHLEENYKNGEKEGKQYSWYENGKLEFERNYKNGQKEGKQYDWYKNGKLCSKYIYKNGRLCTEYNY
jgi:antitoxin component YwqK of YwqJK toxin-antitoxin module